MILRQYIVHHDFIDNPEFTRELKPFCTSMLDALNKATGMEHTQGELQEVSDDFWIFIYGKDYRRQKVSIARGKEEMEFGKQASTMRTPAQPRFK